MFELKLLFVLSINFFCIVNARSVSLSQKELQSVGSVLKTALGHHLDKKLGFKITGTFVFEENSENPEDYDFTIELNDSVVPEGALSGNVTMQVHGILINLLSINRKRCAEWSR